MHSGQADPRQREFRVQQERFLVQFKCGLSVNHSLAQRKTPGLQIQVIGINIVGGHIGYAGQLGIGERRSKRAGNGLCDL